MSHPSPEACAACPAHHLANLKKLGVDMAGHDYVVALAGNPNTGKSTVFNALTGLRQHTGNWPGKTVTRAEGGFAARRPALQAGRSAGHLLAAVGESRRGGGARLPPLRPARRDGGRGRRHPLERNLNLVLQVLEITDRVVVCLNLMDEARRRGLDVDPRRLARDLGVPVVATAARQGEGLPELMQAISRGGHRRGRRHAASRRRTVAGAAAGRHAGSATRCAALYPELPNAALGGAAAARRRRADPDARCARANSASCTSASIRPRS